jgi:hypothetical protein
LNPLRASHHVSQFSGLLLGLSLYFYHVRELLVCWLIFTLLFACVTLLVLGGVLAVQTGEYLTVWVRTLPRMTPVVALGHVELPLKYLRLGKVEQPSPPIVAILPAGVRLSPPSLPGRPSETRTDFIGL